MVVIFIFDNKCNRYLLTLFFFAASLSFISCQLSLPLSYHSPGLKIVIDPSFVFSETLCLSSDEPSSIASSLAF
jgi:hypothetical protein